MKTHQASRLRRSTDRQAIWCCSHNASPGSPSSPSPLGLQQQRLNLRTSIGVPAASGKGPVAEEGGSAGLTWPQWLLASPLCAAAPREATRTIREKQADMVQILGCKPKSRRVWGLLGALRMVGMAEPLGSIPSMEKKHGKAAKPSKEPARKSLIQIDWDSRDGGKGEQY